MDFGKGVGFALVMALLVFKGGDLFGKHGSFIKQYLKFHSAACLTSENWALNCAWGRAKARALNHAGGCRDDHRRRYR